MAAERLGYVTAAGLSFAPTLQLACFPEYRHNVTNRVEAEVIEDLDAPADQAENIVGGTFRTTTRPA